MQLIHHINYKLNTSFTAVTLGTCESHMYPSIFRLLAFCLCFQEVKHSEICVNYKPTVFPFFALHVASAIYQINLLSLK